MLVLVLGMGGTILEEKESGKEKVTSWTPLFFSETAYFIHKEAIIRDLRVLAQLRLKVELVGAIGM